MGILTFKGGVHPYDGKELSKNSPVVKYLPKGDMVYPLSQHIGAPAAAIVQKGDHVLAGQKIADAAGFVSSPIHSSVSGTVKGIEPRLTATGSMVNSIIIENDQQYESVEFTPARLEDLSKEEILARIKACCGGLRHAGSLPVMVGVSHVRACHVEVSVRRGVGHRSEGHRVVPGDVDTVPLPVQAHHVPGVLLAAQVPLALDGYALHAYQVHEQLESRRVSAADGSALYQRAVRIGVVWALLEKRQQAESFRVVFRRIDYVVVYGQLALIVAESLGRHLGEHMVDRLQYRSVVLVQARAAPGAVGLDYARFAVAPLPALLRRLRRRLRGRRRGRG